ncbi:MAG TPA: hypothetical protein VF255_01645 [Solirubrobacterales bacterium]
MLAHVGGFPVEELLPLAYGLTGVGAVVHVAMRRRLGSLRLRERRSAKKSES